MSTITNSTNLVPVGNQVATASPTTSSTSGTQATKQLGQKDFLKLLVAQMKNQDPTKPMDNFQFLSQMAQFGMVNGIQSLQTTFGNVAQSFDKGQLLQASSLLGHHVLTDGNAAVLSSNDPVKGAINLASAATNINVDVRTPGGTLVASFPMGDSAAGTLPFSWNGVDSAGNKAQPGQYVIDATGTVNGKQQQLSVSTNHRVDSVAVNADKGVELTLDTGATAAFSTVKQID